MVDIDDWEYHPSVWTGKRMERHFTRLDRRYLREEQIQPNGIDLTVDKILIQPLGPTLAVKKEHNNYGTLMEVPLTDIAGIPPQNRSWFLNPGYYIVEWTEIIEIPKNVIGLLSPRSTLLRMGGTIFGAVWDRGYKGKGQSGMYLHVSFLLEHQARLAQIIFIDAQEDEQLYDGQYQGEGLEEGQD